LKTFREEKSLSKVDFQSTNAKQERPITCESPETNQNFISERALLPNSTSLTFPYFNQRLLTPEMPYNESTWRSLALSSELIDLRLAASRYASAFSSFRPFRRNNVDFAHSSTPSSSTAEPTFGAKFYEHLIPRYDARAFFMLPTMRDVLNSGNTTTNPLTSSWLLSSLVNSKNP